MVSIYDEINQIKREGNPYDSNLENYSIETQQAFAPGRFSRPGDLAGGNVGFIGNLVPENFGKSRYDKGTN